MIGITVKRVWGRKMISHIGQLGIEQTWIKPHKSFAYGGLPYHF